MDISDNLRYKQILSDCFWDSNISEEGIAEIFLSGNKQKEKYLFEKILLNSTNLLLDLKLFKKNRLKILMKEFKVPVFNYDYIFRRKNIVEVYFFNAPLLVEELKWKI